MLTKEFIGKIFTFVLIILNLGIFGIILNNLSNSKEDELTQEEVLQPLTNGDNKLTNYLIAKVIDENTTELSIVSNQIVSIELELNLENSDITFVPSINFNTVILNETALNKLSIALSNIENTSNIEYTLEGGVVIGKLTGGKTKINVVSENSNYTDSSGNLININELKLSE